MAEENQVAAPPRRPRRPRLYKRLLSQRYYNLTMLSMVGTIVFMILAVFTSVFPDAINNFMLFGSLGFAALVVLLHYSHRKIQFPNAFGERWRQTGNWRLVVAICIGISVTLILLPFYLSALGVAESFFDSFGLVFVGIGVTVTTVVSVLHIRHIYQQKLGNPYPEGIPQNDAAVEMQNMARGEKAINFVPPAAPDGAGPEGVIQPHAEIKKPGVETLSAPSAPPLPKGENSDNIPFAQPYPVPLGIDLIITPPATPSPSGQPMASPETPPRVLGVGDYKAVAADSPDRLSSSGSSSGGSSEGRSLIGGLYRRLQSAPGTPPNPATVASNVPHLPPRHSIGEIHKRNLFAQQLQPGQNERVPADSEEPGAIPFPAHGEEELGPGQPPTLWLAPPR